MGKLYGATNTPHCAPPGEQPWVEISLMVHAPTDQVFVTHMAGDSYLSVTRHRIEGERTTTPESQVRARDGMGIKRLEAREVPAALETGTLAAGPERILVRDGDRFVDVAEDCFGYARAPVS